MSHEEVYLKVRIVTKGSSINENNDDDGDDDDRVVPDHASNAKMTEEMILENQISCYVLGRLTFTEWYLQ